MEKRIVPIVFATDDNYVLPLAVAIKSMLDHKNSNDEYRIYIFCDKLSEKSIDILKQICGGGGLFGDSKNLRIFKRHQF